MTSITSIAKSTMANLLRDCPFTVFPSWTRLNHLGMRSIRIQEQPPKTSTVRYNFNNSERKCDIVMDDAQCGPEWPLKYTIPDFQKNCVLRFTLENNDRFTVFSRCLFGLGAAYWDEVLSKIAGHTNADSDKAITPFLEKVAQVQNLQDSILRWVSK